MVNYTDTDPLLGTEWEVPSGYSSTVPPLPKRKQRDKANQWKTVTSLLGFVALVLFAVALTQTILLLSRPRDILDPIAREQLRKEWASERDTHKKEHEQWQLERKQHDGFIEHWKQEQVEYAEELADRVQERKAWEAEKTRHDEEDKRWEKERWDRMQLYWGDIWRNDRCHAYAIREYTARLWNIAPGNNGLEACRRTPITINDKELPSPTSCEDRGRDGIHGRWLVNFAEPACQPYWGSLYDKGCVAEGSRMHRVEARLENIARGDDWQTMCNTTPNIVHGIKFKHPTSCENRGTWSGMVGIWEYPDPRC